MWGDGEKNVCWGIMNSEIKDKAIIVWVAQGQEFRNVREIIGRISFSIYLVREI